MFSSLPPENGETNVSSDRIVYDEYGNKYTLTEQIGEGGQGAVYRVNQGAGRNLAIKIRKDETGEGILKDEKAYVSTMRMVRRIMALPMIDQIAFPIAMLQKPCCGYVMRFMDRLVPVAKYMVPEATSGEEMLKEYFEAKGGLEKKIRMLDNLARVLRQLHNHGIVYGDLSPGNIFVSRDDMEYQAWLIDIDNLRYESDNNICIGTPRYMAPEIFNGTRNTMASDCYSFALIAFECLTWSKPFNGTIIYEEPDDDFGACPEDLMDSGDIPYIFEGSPRNQPVTGFQKNIRLLITDELYDLFMRTFSEEGRKNPFRRPGMNEWARAFSNASASLVRCRGKHMHTGGTCLLCKAKGIKNDTDPCYTVQTYKLVDACIPDKDGGQEEDDSIDAEIRELPVICMNKFIRFVLPDGKKEIRVSIPYRLLASAHPVRREDDIAFDIVFSGGKVSVARLLDSRLKVLYMFSSESGFPDGSVVRVAYNGNNKFEFRIARENL